MKTHLRLLTCISLLLAFINSMPANKRFALMNDVFNKDSFEESSGEDLANEIHSEVIDCVSNSECLDAYRWFSTNGTLPDTNGGKVFNFIYDRIESCLNMPDCEPIITKLLGDLDRK